jgi:hypothetical protein
MKRYVLKLSLLYKLFPVNTANVLVMKEQLIRHVFVSVIFIFIYIFLLFDIIDALADTIRKCISQLHDLSEHQARYYCGYTLMKYCAVHLGLDGYPLKFDA